ncbi:probable polygalacturonase At3g15720 [Diospyros lotus]|uniref:probable polygalacturonase At3g15720 n=1 Tax=Diospyros lotus TaxID=55363 RepID=UPI00224FDBEE|nr:probable polygalacturonase At3g15720 [Diospyros lotus]
MATFVLGGVSGNDQKQRSRDHGSASSSRPTRRREAGRGREAVREAVAGFGEPEAAGGGSGGGRQRAKWWRPHGWRELFMVLVLCMANLLGSSSFTCQQEAEAGSASGVFDVLNYEAIGNGITDDSNAFLSTWKAACDATMGAPVLCVPDGKTFLLNPVRFEGPCKSSSITIKVYGKLVAPHIDSWPSQSSKNWLIFLDVNGLIVNGTGQFDGQGAAWWDRFRKEPDIERPTALQFVNCDNLQLSGLTHINSPRNHISVVGCNGSTFSNLHITAPGDSPNTDGIDISKSSNLKIYDCIIATGDDCIAMLGGSANINITRVACGPGHGISIGSLGEDGTTDEVEEVHVTNCSFNGTRNGARIKTWQGGNGYARHISYQDIRLIAVANPIIIDQFYCNNDKPCINKTAAVQISNVTFTGFRGTSVTNDAIDISCSETVGCTDIVLYNVNITAANLDETLRSLCLNAHGTSTLTSPVVEVILYHEIICYKCLVSSIAMSFNDESETKQQKEIAKT